MVICYYDTTVVVVRTIFLLLLANMMASPAFSCMVYKFEGVTRDVVNMASLLGISRFWTESLEFEDRNKNNRHNSALCFMLSPRLLHSAPQHSEFCSCTTKSPAKTSEGIFWGVQVSNHHQTASP